MKTIIFIFTILFQLSCGQSDVNPKGAETKKIDPVNRNEADSPQATKDRYPAGILDNWLKEACGINHPFSKEDLDKLNFSTLNYYATPPSNELKKLLKEPILVRLIKDEDASNSITISPYSISFEYSYDEPGTGRALYLLEKKVFYTQWYVTAAETYEYDLASSKLKILPYSVNSINNRIANIEKSYYDSKGPNDPAYKGHIFIDGKLDILTGKITWEEDNRN